MATRCFISTSLIGVALLAGCSGSNTATPQPADVTTPAEATPTAQSETPVEQSPTQTPDTASPTTVLDPTSTPTSTPSATSTAPESRLIDYRTSSGPQGVKISNAGGTEDLAGAPDTFKAFMEHELQRAQGEFSGTPPQINVKGLHTDGYALGGLFAPGEGGAAAIWAVKDGSWQRIWSGQNIPECAPLREVNFPAALLAFDTKECFDGRSTVAYASGRTASASARTKTPTASSTKSSSGSSASEESCAITDSMIAALTRKGLHAGDGPSATCAGEWALLRSSEGGDSEILLQRRGSGWQFYTGFPSQICRSKYLADGGAQAYARRLRSC